MALNRSKSEFGGNAQRIRLSRANIPRYLKFLKKWCSNRQLEIWLNGSLDCGNLPNLAIAPYCSDFSPYDLDHLHNR